jgi:hypothetical protein
MAVADDWDETQWNLEPNPHRESLFREMDPDGFEAAASDKHRTQHIGFHTQASYFPLTKSHPPTSPSNPLRTRLRKETKPPTQQLTEHPPGIKTATHK